MVWHPANVQAVSEAPSNSRLATGLRAVHRGQMWNWVRIAGFCLAGLATLMVAAAQTSPQDAKTNIASWYNELLSLEPPSWLNVPAVDDWFTGAGLLILIAAVGMIATPRRINTWRKAATLWWKTHELRWPITKRTSLALETHGKRLDYVASKLRLFCVSALDPASDALQSLSTERRVQLELRQPDMGPVLSEYRYLVNRPREQIHDLLDKMTDDYPFSEQVAARILKEYLAGYVRAIKLVMDSTDRKVLVKRADYAEWRIRHRELLRLRDELRKDKRLEAIETILGCTELPELRDHPAAAAPPLSGIEME